MRLLMSVARNGTAVRRKSILFCSAVLLSVPAGNPQSSSAPLTFEAASVRTAPPDRPGGVPVAGGPGTKDPGLFTGSGIPLLPLVMQAYDLKFRFQLAWLPWMETERYSIRAKVPPGTSKDQFRVMLQNLLVERFALKVHRETRNMSGYWLVVAKGGPKLTPSAPPPPVQPVQAEPSPATTLGKNGLPPGVVIGRSGTPELAPGNTPHELVTRAGHFLRARRETAEYLAFRLSRELQRPVSDATGLKGEYDYTLIWSPDHLMARSADSDSGGEPEAPPLFEALERQLGLKLQPVKRSIPVDVLVVDYARKIPTEN